MKLSFLLAFVAFAVAFLPSRSSACTAFQLKSKDGAQVYLRSMEFGMPFNSKALIVPRGTEYTGTAPGGKPGLEWKTKYGVVGLNAEFAPNIVADGQNEKGLAIGMLYLPGYAQYQDASASAADKSVGSWEVPIYLLSTCATVDEAVAALKNDLYVAQQEFVPFKESLPVHWWIGDATGKVVIAEYIDGKLNIHDAPLGTLTNSPPYDWQTINVGNYVDLSPVNVPERTLGKFTSVNYGQGSGAIGLPGDMSPPSRFIRAALFSHWATPGDTAIDTVNVGFHVLNTFDIFNGAIKSNTAAQKPNTKAFLSAEVKPKLVNTDTTEWVVAHDRTNLKTYIRTYNGLEIQMVDLKKANFDEPGLRTIDLQNDFAPEDITGQGKPLAQSGS
ncbi:MAG: Choloylglycine hydrolase [Verrucomicrobiota bacterium]|jgi:choloylglycine hydrolase